MEVFDNVSKIVKDDLEVSIDKGSRLSIAAACFSIYAYQALKNQLDDIEELRFIFTSPAFVKEKVAKERQRACCSMSRRASRKAKPGACSVMLLSALRSIIDVKTQSDIDRSYKLGGPLRCVS